MGGRVVTAQPQLPRASYRTLGAHDRDKIVNIDQRRERLIAWLEVIRDDVQDLLREHHIFWEIQSLIRANPRFAGSSNLVNQWMASAFAKSSSVGVRRQAKRGDDSISLKRFLTEARDYPELVSRDFYLAYFADSPDWLRETSGHGHFDSVAGPGNPHIRREVVEEQLATLEATVASIEHYVDRRVAHYDKRGVTKPLPTFKDLEVALKALESLVIFYWTLLKGASIVELTPAIQYNWIDVFEFPWVTRDDDGA